jgi:hypothetical protein
LTSRSDVTSAALVGIAAASMLPANSTMRTEPLRLAMNASQCDCAPLRWDSGLAIAYITWKLVSAGSQRRYFPIISRIKRTRDIALERVLAPRSPLGEDREPVRPSAMAALHGRSGKPFSSSTSAGIQVSPTARVYYQAKLACRAAESHGKIWGVGLMGVLTEQ